MSSRKRGNAGGSSSQAKRARIEPPAPSVPDTESSLSSVNGSQPGTPPPIQAGAAASKGLPGRAGRTMVPTEAGAVDETTMGAENLPHADAPSSPEMPLATAPPPRIKREEDDTDVALLAGGTTIDSEQFKDETGPTRERPAIAEERHRVIVFHVVTSAEPSSQSAIILTGVKNIFQKQLPKMPREYIARLVYDRNHLSMAFVKRGLNVVGAITYRPFAQRGFAEIVFCAITGTEQVKGYGQHLMNHLKDHIREVYPSIDHFLTYGAADGALGYFRKQGFTKDISLDRSVWAGYIKDYEGGTLMQCTMLPARVSYLDARVMLAQQKAAILAKIREFSRSHIVHRGRDIFPPGVTSVDPSSVPGLRELGWTPQMDELTRRPERGPEFSIMQRLLTDMQNQPAAWAFSRPVNKDEVLDYYTVIKEPMDLETMEAKLEHGSYQDLAAFLYDANLIFKNCRQYNSAESNYYKNSIKLEQCSSQPQQDPDVADLNERLKRYTDDPNAPSTDDEVVEEA